jgi:cysteine desulfurase
LIYGGGHERALRAGTENLPGIIAFGCAASELSGGGEWQRQQTLLDKIVRELRSEISSIVVHSDHNYGLPNTLSLGIEGLDGHALAINLDLAGIAVSTGSACSTGSIDPSPVLDAMGVSPSLNLGSIRVSVGAQTTIDDIDYFVTQYIQSVRQMQSG